MPNQTNYSAVTIEATTAHECPDEIIEKFFKQSLSLDHHNSNDSLFPDWRIRITNFLQKQDDSARIFVARDRVSKEVLGVVGCQRWQGPVPIEVLHESSLSIGSIWGLAASSNKLIVENALLRKALCYLKEDLKCHKVVTMCPQDSAEATAYQIHGFKHDNMMTLPMETFQDTKNSQTVYLADSEAIKTQLVDESCDDVVVDHWRKMWLDVGVPPDGLKDNMKHLTLEFIQSARDFLEYQTIVAKADNGDIVGSISCQVWKGPCPQIYRHKVGTIWAVYVQESYRRNGVATAMMRSALTYLQSIGCKTTILIAASEEGKRVYQRLGFAPNSAMVCDDLSSIHLDEAQSLMSNPILLQELRAKISETIHADATQMQLQAMVSATTAQMGAAFGKHPDILQRVKSFQCKNGLFIDPRKNWFTDNIQKFGKGFDMKKLIEDEAKLASKFDKLSGKYDQWTVGNQSKIERFVASCASRVTIESSRSYRILDVACGPGLQGQVLRLCGYKGYLEGTDISPGMIDRVIERGCYDATFVSNANHGLIEQAHKKPYDVVICTGAAELLDHASILRSFNSLLSNRGEIWVSFQHDEYPERASGPTEHQGVRGIPIREAVAKLEDAGFKIVSLESCQDAFCTPVGGALSEVPYLFIVASKV